MMRSMQPYENRIGETTHDRTTGDVSSRCCAPMLPLFASLELGRPPSTIVILLIIVATLWLLLIHLPKRAKRSDRGGSFSRSMRILLTSLRMGAWIVLLLIAGRLFLSLSEPVRPTLVVLLDDSPSMLQVDSEDVAESASDDEGMSRLDIAENIIRDIPTDGSEMAGGSEAIDPRMPKVRLVRLSQLFPDLVQSGGMLTGSPLGESILEAADITVEPPAGIALRDIPLFTVAPGRSVPIRRCQISDFRADSPVYVGDVIGMSVRLQTEGLADRDVAVSLRMEGSDQVLDRRIVTSDSQTHGVTVPLFYRANQAAKIRFSVQAATVDSESDEGSPTNDSLPKVVSDTLMQTVEVSDRPIRVLLVFEEPCFEFRFLWNTLFRDSSLRVDAVLTGAAPEVVESDQPVEGTQQMLRRLPIREDQLATYDVVIIGDVDPAALGTSMMENLATAIDRSGSGAGLMLVAGPRFMPAAYGQTPLARFLPFSSLQAREMEGVGRTFDASDRFARPLKVEPTAAGENYPPLQLADMLSAESGNDVADLDCLLPVCRCRAGRLSWNRCDMAVATRCGRAILCSLLVANASIFGTRSFASGNG